MIDKKDRQTLLSVARRSIEAIVRDQRFTPEIPESGPLAEPRGAFVTITEAGSLRGCIGRVVTERPLVEVVADMAAAAATGDPRFHPLQEAELDRVQIEVSALSPLRPVTGQDDVVVGRDGLLIRHGSQSGLLLPQVATDHGWDSERFLEETCRKAGLPLEAWRKDAIIEAFEAEVWGE